jgi:hypothetical protein
MLAMAADYASGGGVVVPLGPGPRAGVAVAPRIIDGDKLS